MRPLRYFRTVQDSALIYDERSLLAHTSPALAGQVVEHVHAQALRKVPFFADASNECFVDIAMRLQRRLFTPGELIFRERQLGSEMYRAILLPRNSAAQFSDGLSTTATGI